MSRMDKINAEMQKAISEVITYNLQNPNINGIITVTKVDTSNNLEYAKVYVSIMTPGDKQDVFNSILHSAGYIRKEVCRKLDLRKMPFLEFNLDMGIEYTAQINELIKDIEKERKNNIDENK